MRTKNEQTREGQLIHGPVVKFLCSPLGTPSRIVSGIPIHCLTENTDCCLEQPEFSVVYDNYSTCFVTLMLAFSRKSVIHNFRVNEFLEHLEIIQITYRFILFINPEGLLSYLQNSVILSYHEYIQSTVSNRIAFSQNPYQHFSLFTPRFPLRIQNKILRAFLIPHTRAVCPIYFSCIMTLRMKRSDYENRIIYFLQPLYWVQICSPILPSPVQAMS